MGKLTAGRGVIVAVGLLLLGVVLVGVWILRGRRLDVDLRRFLGPQPGQTYVYEFRRSGKPVSGSEGRATGRSVDGTSGLVISNVLVGPPLASVTFHAGQYLLRADAEDLTIDQGERPPVTVLRKPLRAGNAGWEQPCSIWTPAEEIRRSEMSDRGNGLLSVPLSRGHMAEQRAQCRICSVGRRLILGRLRSTVTVTCRQQDPEGRTFDFLEEWAVDVGLVRSVYALRSRDGGLFQDELVLTKIEHQAGSTPPRRVEG